jgi:hypothetical protein
MPPEAFTWTCGRDSAALIQLRRRGRRAENRMIDHLRNIAIRIKSSHLMFFVFAHCSPLTAHCLFAAFTCVRSPNSPAA